MAEENKRKGDSEAKKRWMAENTMRVTLRLNHNTDKDLLKYLQERESEGLSFAGAFKEALKEKIRREADNK